MLFWIVAGLLASVVAVLIARPLLAPSAAGAEAVPDQAIYRDQLAEVERDLARGVLAPEEAERARTEIARRLLAADRAGATVLRAAPRRAGLVAASLAAVVVVMGSLVLYATIGRPGAPDDPRAARLAEAQRLRDERPSQADAETQAAQVFPAQQPDVPEEYLEMVERLREVVPTRPDDLQGWELLAQHEAQLGRYAEARAAQERVIAIKGDRATADDHVALVDRMVAAAGGVVTPEAEAVMARIDRMQPGNFGLLYYLGLMQAQTGRPDLAFPFWRRLMEAAPADDLHRSMAASEIERLAWLAGVDYEPPAAAPGPSEAEVAAAQEMTEEERREMIRGMVDGLRGRLTAEGGPAQDWARLVTSLSILGDEAGAREALAQGKAAHAGDAQAQVILDGTAQQAGLTE
ncbi:c-type cytochrome biogenesis protein CcmI [Rubellimicrobium aerolatum]|uniref:C-type cytochrome biogenesis protein CcmI n=1 Tax=Rubellimicrobium aerolatum TaxID=490979 RepID=A0ABW0SBJ6_9RHOB|nr:c-type cytochrome biogenesis protein CcmI [Rubellimicrobium aerolatum]MBP1805568.1 cytochrome c-type biogenesis protein CcmH [Rubellimicrobium aerolatum]